MVVVPGQVFRELPARELAGAEHPVDDPGVFEHDQVPVDGALREALPAVEDLGDRERPRRVRERVDEGFAVGSEPLPDAAQPVCRGVAHLLATDRHASECTGGFLRYRPTVDALGRFTALVQGPAGDVALDEAALLVAAHAHSAVDLDAWLEAQLGALDALAASCDCRDATELATALFRTRGFRGNTANYYDPRNSYLDQVLARGLGIPITLSVLMIEVGRRRGLELHGVGMPGHFLVGGPSGAFYDPFSGGAALDGDACRARYEAMQLSTPFRRELLAPVGALAILDRMLTNLQGIFIRGDTAQLAWVLRLRLRIPTGTPVSRAEIAAWLARVGHFEEAAAAFDDVAAKLHGRPAAEAAHEAARLRARAN
jgi:regulator of sirC expression with transglutaminase-like and TPR domain